MSDRVTLRTESVTPTVTESVTYVTELCHLSEHCNLGGQLNEMLGDQIVCRIEDPKFNGPLVKPLGGVSKAE